MTDTVDDICPSGIRLCRAMIMQTGKCLNNLSKKMPRTPIRYCAAGVFYGVHVGVSMYVGKLHTYM